MHTDRQVTIKTTTGHWILAITLGLVSGFRSLGSTLSWCVKKRHCLELESFHSHQRACGSQWRTWAPKCPSSDTLRYIPVPQRLASREINEVPGQCQAPGSTRAPLNGKVRATLARTAGSGCRPTAVLGRAVVKALVAFTEKPGWTKSQ